MSETTASTNTNPLATLDQMLEAKRKFDKLPKGEWLLISPDGRVWGSPNPAELLPILIPYHPLLQGVMP